MPTSYNEMNNMNDDDCHSTLQNTLPERKHVTEHYSQFARSHNKDQNTEGVFTSGADDCHSTQRARSIINMEPRSHFSSCRPSSVMRRHSASNLSSSSACASEEGDTSAMAVTAKMRMDKWGQDRIKVKQIGGRRVIEWLKNTDFSQMSGKQSKQIDL
jgi:hypothetical protein